MFSEHVKVFDNLFTNLELQQIQTALDSIPSINVYAYENLGRLHNEELILPQNIQDKLTSLVCQHLGTTTLKLKLNPISVEYSAKYGQPHLPPHFDRDDTDYILDYQFSSSTSWPLGVDRNLYELRDNSAVGFNPNGNIHWRPHKTFNEGEFTRMIFFRFFNEDNPSDYSHLPENIGEPEFVALNEYRDSLSN